MGNFRRLYALIRHGSVLAVDPEWRRLRSAERAAQRRHASVRHIQKAKSERVHAMLRGAR